MKYNIPMCICVLACFYVCVCICACLHVCVCLSVSVCVSQCVKDVYGVQGWSRIVREGEGFKYVLILHQVCVQQTLSMLQIFLKLSLGRLKK